MDNCWDFKECGRQPGGHAIPELGTCPVALESRAEGINDGINGGRSCWAIAGSLCDGKVQGNFAKKLMDCGSCSFAHKVMQEQGTEFVNATNIISRLSI